MSSPKKLYKYLSLSPRAIQNLCLGETFYADPSTFNDPLDCKPRLKIDVGISELQDILAKLVVRRVSKEVSESMKKLRFKQETIVVRQEKLANNVFNTLIQNIQYEATNPDVEDADAHTRFALGNAIEFEVRRNFERGVLCLSSRYDSPLMWSHYGDQHRGICIEFDVSNLAAGSIRRVQYGESRELAASAVRDWLHDVASTAISEVERACLLTKSSEWRYEEEYRLFGSLGLQPSAAPMKSITFGMRCEEALKYVVISSLGGRNSVLGFNQIAQPSAQFGLSRDEVNVDECLAGMPRINILQDFPLLEVSE